ncbi:hypothetical protein BAE44_0010634 [Dichanthelium oligosanthes]|uniref:Hyaluronan/mRNA-binding protein domain-containing protein n=1 Tax=Dichanthelium oligosanthes TaxID=888268 RepID=A0A1E5VT92_9POAL|nr:hypothetical protein BAE44_0010634 [Dichanthelium oligosanthes]
MATLNMFDILGADDNDDPTQLIAAAAAAAQKAEAKKATAALAGKGAQPAAGAKFPTKPAPPSQAVRDARGGGAPARGGFGRGERGRGRGGRGYGQNRDFGGDNANGFQGGYGGGGFGDGAVTGGAEGERERGPRPPYRGGGRRGGYRNGEFGDDSERPPRRNYERHSGTGRGYEMKRDGAGRGNWGTATDEVLAQETEEALKVEEGAPIAEKQGEQNETPAVDENKDNKDAAAADEEEKEEDKEMTLEEFEKIREEKRKALLALKAEERKVELDKDLQSLQPLSNKKENDEVFIKLSVSINEFLKPAEGERFYGGRGRGRGRGERGGFRGGYGGGYNRGPAAAPSIEDQAQFPSLGGK